MTTSRCQHLMVFTNANIKIGVIGSGFSLDSIKMTGVHTIFDRQITRKLVSNKNIMYSIEQPLAANKHGQRSEI